MGLGVHVAIGVDPSGPQGIVQLDVGGKYRARVRGRAAALPCRMNTIDRVSIGGGLEGLRRSEAVALLRECRRILAPDGRLTVGALDIDAIVARQIEPADPGDATTPRHARADECERLTRRLRGCQWVASKRELGELASQVGLMALPGDRAPAGEEKQTGHTILEFAKRLQSFSTTRPLVSVLVPAFNPRFFAEAIESVLAQTYENLELVICDDCPTDEIKGLTARYGARDSRITYFKNESRLGSRQNHIRCLGLASGELIKFLADDDRLRPECLERMVACLVGFPEVTLVTSHRQCIDEAGRHLADLDATLRPVSEDSRVDGAALARAVLMHGGLNVIGGPSTTMCRRPDLVDTRPDLFSFNGRRYQTMGDMVMWLHLLSKGDAIYLVETLSDFRLHPEQEQRSEHVRATAAQGLARMQADAGRMGLIPEDAPTRLQWTPLGARRPWWPESIAGDVGPATLDLLPDDPWLLVLLARGEQQSGNLQAARQRLARASAIAPDLPCVHGALAVVLHRLGQDAEAEAAAARTLTLNPSDADALALLAELHATRRASENEEADAALELDGDLDHWPAADQLVGGLVAVEGWLGSRAPATVDVRVLVDGCTWPAWVRRLSGLNMAPPSSWLAPQNSMPRFRLMIDTRSIPDGRHVLTFVALAGAGRILILGQRPVVIRNRELLGAADGPAHEVAEHLVRERNAQRLEFEGRLDAVARERDAQRLEFEGRLEMVVRERDGATARLERMLHTWPVRLYGRAMRLPGVGGLMRWIVGRRP
jgi:hypothetical protein